MRTSVDWVLDFRQAPIGRACTVPFLGIHFREHRESSPTTRQNLAVFHQRPFRGESYEDGIDYDQSTEGMHWDRNRANYYYQGITGGGALVSVSGIRQELFLVFGLTLMTFAVALRRELGAGRGAVLIPIFQFLSGVGVAGDAIFVHQRVLRRVKRSFFQHACQEYGALTMSSAVVGIRQLA